MLSINNNSLYFKWLRGSSNDFARKLLAGRVTLCSLFWKTVFLAIIQCGLLALVILFSVSAGNLLAGILGITFTLATTPWYVIIGMSLAGLASICLFAGALFGTGTLIAIVADKIMRWYEDREFARSMKEDTARSEPIRLGNVYQKMKIYKKDKLCPLIRVEHVE